MALLIKPGKDENGQPTISPPTLALLVEFKEHENLCDQCTAAVKLRTGRYCATGKALFMQILEEPGVIWVPENYGIGKHL